MCCRCHLQPYHHSLTKRPDANVLGKLGKTIGPGAVVCFVERDVPLSEAVSSIPAAYL